MVIAITEHADRAVSGHHPARGRGIGRVSRSRRADDRTERRHAARRKRQRRERHDLHAIDQLEQRQHVAAGVVRRRHGSRHEYDLHAEPRIVGHAHAPAGRHQARSHDRENDEQFHSGTVALLGRQIRRKLLGQLRDPAYQGPAGADQRRGKRPGHGRRRLCDAHLGQARPNGLSGSDRRRHRFGHRTAERGDTRRPARRRA